MLTDPIADLLTRIRNAQMVGAEYVELPYSKLKENVAKALKKSGFVSDVSVFKEKGKAGKMLRVDLLYHENQPKVTNVEKVSRPGLRVYSGYKELPTVIGGYGVAIVSTPNGIMTAQEAKKKKVGGEVICKVW